MKNLHRFQIFQDSTKIIIKREKERNETKVNQID